MKNKWFAILCVLLVFGLLFSACDLNGDNGNNKLTLTGYSKGDIVSRSIVASRSLARLVSDDTYNSSTYRSFPIDNHEKSARDREVTVDAILQFERDVPGYDDDPDGYVGYYNNHSSYPSTASTIGEEGVYLVFDSRDPSERYQVGYHHINRVPSHRVFREEASLSKYC